jgi:hypothetical protein
MTLRTNTIHACKSILSSFKMHTTVVLKTKTSQQGLSFKIKNKTKQNIETLALLR